MCEQKWLNEINTVRYQFPQERSVNLNELNKWSCNITCIEFLENLICFKRAIKSIQRLDILNLDNIEIPIFDNKVQDFIFIHLENPENLVMRKLYQICKSKVKRKYTTKT